MKSEGIRRIFFFVLEEVVSLGKRVLCGYFWDFELYSSLFYYVCNVFPNMRYAVHQFMWGAVLGDRHAIAKTG